MFACRSEAQHETLGRNVHHVGCDTCECVRVSFYYLTAWFHYFWFLPHRVGAEMYIPCIFFFKLHLQWHVSLSVERLQGVLPWLWAWKKCMAERLLHCYGNPNHAGSRDVLSQPSVSLRHTHFTVYMRCNGPLINSKTIPTHSKSKSCDVSKKSDKSTVISDNVTLIFFSLLTNNEMLRKHLWSI